MSDVITPKTTELDAIVALVNADRLADAERMADSLLPSHPQSGVLWKILSVARARQGKDALPALRKAAELMPNDAEAYRNLGAALQDRGQAPEASAVLLRALAIKPDDIETLVDAANALKAIGSLHESIVLYKRALYLRPGHAEARNNLGNVFLQLGHYEAAAACYRHALDLQPGDAQILCNLSNALRLLGRLDEAMAGSREALARDPSLSVAHNISGLILAAQQRLEEAIASYRRALVLNPSYVDALNNLGNALRETGARREALSVYARGVELDPRRAESHCNLGNALFELGRVDDAALSFGRVVSLAPSNVLGHLGLASTLRIQRRGAEAEASCRAALALDPNHDEALYLMGVLLADRGRFADAEELFRRVIALHPESTRGFVGVAAHRKMSGGEGAWLKGVEALLAKRLSLAQTISLRYALGKYFDDVELYDRAFDQYRQANELTRRYGATYDRAKLTQHIDAIIRSDSSLRERHHPGAPASRSETPVLIVGMPRSGTSLVEQILASHPAVFGAGEVTFWNAAYEAFSAADCRGNADIALIAGIAQDYLGRLNLLSGGAQRVIDKMPANFLYAGLIHATLPNARIIHVHRHPLDTCLSIYFQHFFSMGPHANDFGNLAHYYNEYRRIMDHWRRVLPDAALLEVPYEGLINDQEAWTRRLVEFIGLPWDPRCLDFHRTERVVITASKWQVRQRLSTASVGRWRHYDGYLTELKEALGEALHGYRD